MNYEHDFCHCEQSESIQSMYKQLKFKKDAGLLRFARNDKNSAQRLIYATTLLSQGMTPNLVISPLIRCVYPGCLVVLRLAQSLSLIIKIRY